MKWKSVVLFLTLCLSFTFGLRAHESGKHVGKPVAGEVISVADGKMEVKTSKGTQNVVINDKTKFFEGDQETNLSKIVAGSHVTVYGTTLASGAVVASEITVGMAESSDHGHGKMKGHDHGKMDHKH